MKDFILATLLLLLMVIAVAGQSNSKTAGTATAATVPAANAPSETSTKPSTSTSATTGVQVNGVQVLGTQQPAIPNADGTLSGASTTLNAILRAMRKHGLIETDNAPDTLPGLIADWDPDAIAGANNDPVSTFTDSSGNGHTATQVLPADRPILKTSQANGHAVVRFNGTNQRLDFSPVSNIRAVFFVVKHSLATPNMDTQIQGLVIGDSSTTAWAGESGIQMTSFVTGTNVLDGNAYEAGVPIPVLSLPKSPI